MSFVGDNESAPWEDEIPDWIKNDSGSGGQIAAGDTTILPAPDEPVADSSGRASARQNQPKVAASSQKQPNVAANDDVIVDDSPFTAGVDPLSGTPIKDNPVSTPSTPKPDTSAGKPGKTSTGNKVAANGKPGKQQAKKPAKKITQPTLVGYKVRKGDSLSTIAKKSNTTVAQIRKDSNIKGDIIRPGQTIWVRYTPKGYKAPATPAKNVKGGKGKGAAAVPAPATKGGKTHTVRSGETISAIAKKNGVSTAALLKANGMSNSDAARLRPGRKLVVPKR